jgi:predicted protein tyrosine phosphatase
MKILVLCDEGNNRSVTVAHHLKYWGHDVIAAGLKRNSRKTLQMLTSWADRIILTDRFQLADLQSLHESRFDTSKVDVWDIGPDKYPRPFNKDLLAIVRRMMSGHEGEYKSTVTSTSTPTE